MLEDKPFHDFCMMVSYQMRQLYKFLAMGEPPSKGFIHPVTEDRILDQILQRKQSTPLYDDIFRCLMPIKSHQTAESCLLALHLVARFFSDAREIDTTVAEKKVCCFGVLTGLLNHSCQPNAELLLLQDYEHPDEDSQDIGWYDLRVHRPRIMLQATRPILQGEEITISYANMLMHNSREEWLADIKESYGFDCRCTTCIREEGDKMLLRLKDDVLKLYSEIRNFEDVERITVYRKAAYVLDGFAELDVDSSSVMEVLDICSETAWQCCDMIRAYWFSIRALEHAKSMYGNPTGPERALMREAMGRLELIVDGEGLSQQDIEGYSIFPLGGFDTQQAGIEDLMFGTNHSSNDMEYYCLQKVNGGLEEISKDANKKRLAEIQASRDKDSSEVPNEKKAGRMPLSEMSPAEIARMLQEESDAEKPKKKSRKRNKKRTIPTEELPAASDSLLDDEPPAASNPIAVDEPSAANDAPAPAPFKLEGPGFVTKYGDPNGASKQAWLEAKMRVDKSRDIGHLLAAKDGYAINNEAYVLSMRRDSVCGRVEGRRALVELRGGAWRRARTHSFGNDQGRVDLLKQVDVRGSKW